MSDIERVTITLTAELAKGVRTAVSSGDYASSSEVIRDALREWSLRRARQREELRGLRAEIRKGVADLKAGRVSDFDVADIARAGARKLNAANSG